MKTNVKCFYSIFVLGIIILSNLLPALVSAQGGNSTPPMGKIGDPDLERYPFKPGDGLFINTFPDSMFLDGIYAIDDRGYAEFPIIGKVKVSKMTTVELKDVLRETFSSYMRSTNFYIKPMVRVTLTGGFVRPGLYYFDYNTSLWEVVRNAGGPTLEEGLYESTWQRDGDDIDDIMPYFENGISLKRMGFKSGDQIWTPTTLPRTFWDYTRDILPVLTFATTIILTYYTIQRDFIYMQAGAR